MSMVFRLELTERELDLVLVGALTRQAALLAEQRAVRPGSKWYQSSVAVLLEYEDIINKARALEPVGTEGGS